MFDFYIRWHTKKTPHIERLRNFLFFVILGVDIGLYLCYIVLVTEGRHLVAWKYTGEGVLPMDKLIDVLALIAAIRVVELLTQWAKKDR